MSDTSIVVPQNQKTHKFPSIEVEHNYDTSVAPQEGCKYQGSFRVKNTGDVPVKNIKIYIQADDNLQRWNIKLISNKEDPSSSIQEDTCGSQYIEIKKESPPDKYGQEQEQKKLAPGEYSDKSEYLFTFIPLRPGVSCEEGDNKYSFIISPEYTIEYKSDPDTDQTDSGSTKCS